MVEELKRSAALFIPYVVLHPGARMGGGENSALHRVSESINRIFDAMPQLRPRLLLETTAGQGSGLGHRFEHIAAIIETPKKEDGKDMGRVNLDLLRSFAADPV